MNKSIWEFHLKITDVQTIEAPAFSEPLCVQIKNDFHPCLWMLVMPDMVAKSTYTVRIVGTGHERNDLRASQYVDTIQLQGGALVFHVFVGE